MADKHPLLGLIKWHMRDPWQERFLTVLGAHLFLTSEETNLDAEEIAANVGEDFFTQSVWTFAFEDFLTREFDGGSNIIDEYLKRRGWKESASVRFYLAALRRSVASLYEISDLVSTTSFRARDLVRGGEPILVTDPVAARALRENDRVATRVIEIGKQMRIGGVMLPFEPATSELLLAAFHDAENLDGDDKQELANELGDAFTAELTETDRQHMLSQGITTFWLIDHLEQDDADADPHRCNSDGEKIVFCTARYSLTADATDDDIRTALSRCPEFQQEDETFWRWTRPANATTSPDTVNPSGHEKRVDDGSIALGGIELVEDVLCLTANSSERCDQGCTMLTSTLGDLVRPPWIEKINPAEVRSILKNFQSIDGDFT